MKRFGSRPAPAPFALGLVRRRRAWRWPSPRAAAPAVNTGAWARRRTIRGSAGTTGSAGTSGDGGTTGAAGSNGSGTAGRRRPAAAAARAAPAAGQRRGRAAARAAAAPRAGRDARGTTGNAGATGAPDAPARLAPRAAPAAPAPVRDRQRRHDGSAGAGGSAAPACTVAVGRAAAAPGAEPESVRLHFAWGRQNPSGTGLAQLVQLPADRSRTGSSRASQSDGTYTTCGGCSWLSSRVAGSNLIPVYYAYMIGYYGHMNGLPDQNTNPNGANLATGGAALIKANRAEDHRRCTRTTRATRTRSGRRSRWSGSWRATSSSTPRRRRAAR